MVVVVSFIYFSVNLKKVHTMKQLSCLSSTQSSDHKPKHHTFIGINARELSNLSKEDFIKYTEIILKPTMKSRIRKLSIRFPYQLNCPHDDKLADRDKKYMYTLFINKLGTIGHLLSSESDDMLIRIRFKPSIRFLTNKRQLYIAWKKVSRLVDIEPLIFDKIK